MYEGIALTARLRCNVGSGGDPLVRFLYCAYRPRSSDTSGESAEQRSHRIRRRRVPGANLRAGIRCPKLCQSFLSGPFVVFSDAR